MSCLLTNLAVYKEYTGCQKVHFACRNSSPFHSTSTITPDSRSYHNVVCTFYNSILVNLWPKCREAENALVSVMRFLKIKLLKPNDSYRGRTAPLTSKVAFYIYSTNICTEYFKHGIYSPFFSLQNAVCFLLLTYLVPVLFIFYYYYYACSITTSNTTCSMVTSYYLWLLSF